MKKGLILFIACCSTTSAFTQQLQKSSHFGRPEFELTQLIFGRQQQNAAMHKTTANAKRLIAHSYVVNGNLMDTSRYFYSSGRGSVKNAIYDDFSLTWPVSTHSLKYDSMMREYDSGSGLELVGQRKLQYSNDKVVKLIDDYPYFMSHDVSYNGSGQMTTSTQADSFGSGIVTPTSTTYYIYDANGKRITDSTVDLSFGLSFGKASYQYDASGNLIQFDRYTYVSPSMPNLNLMRTSYTYDANNRYITATYMYDWSFNGTLVPEYKDSLVYTGTSTINAERYNLAWLPASSTWRITDWEINTLTASQNLQSAIYIQVQPPATLPDTIEKIVYNYDGDELLQYTESFTYNNGTFATTPYDRSNFYYEEYFPTQVLSAVATQKPFVIYPNPSAGRLTVQTDATLSGGTISIISAAGQMVFSGKAQKSETQIDVQHLAPGIYVLSVQSTDGISIHQQQFSKL